MPELSVQLAHAADPAVVIRRLVAHVVQHLGMRQDEEGLFPDRLEAELRHRLRLQHPVDGGDMIFVPACHLGPHRLRAEDGHLDAVVAMGQRDPFGKAHGGVFGDTVGRRADLVQKPRGGGGVQQIAAAPRLHQRDEVPRGPDVGHDVHFPDALPLIVGRVHAAAHGDACVGPEQVDGADVGLHLVDHPGDLLFA